MAKIFLYAHGGSGNHGCEAIVRSTVKILNQKDITLISSKPEEDVKYGLNGLCSVVKDTVGQFKKCDPAFWKAYAALKLKNDYIPMEKLRYMEAFSNIKKGDIALSIGGDNYCYADVNKYLMLHDMLKDRGAKTVLWGCSVEPEVAARPEIAADLARYDLITARETITYEALRQINPNTILVTDPAFQLDMKGTTLPENFVVGNTVGINLSPMAMENENVPGITWENYKALVEYILNETDMNIALVPHVVWQDGDDRIPLRALYDAYSGSNRVCMIEDRSCEELKDVISKCRFFVGARTHSTIAAYSTGVPTLVLGYSVKSRGIARDIFGTEDGFVVPVQKLLDSNELKHHFTRIMNREDETRVPLIEYCNKISNEEIHRRMGALMEPVSNCRR